MQGLRLDKSGWGAQRIVRSLGWICVLLACGCQSLRQPSPGLFPDSSAVNLPEAPIIRYQDADEPLPRAAAFDEPQLPDLDSALSAESQRTPDRKAELVKEVRITGNKKVPTHQIQRNIRTRTGRYFDPDLLRQDVDQLWKMKELRRVNGPTIAKTADGVIVTIDVVERPYIGKLKFVGNRNITDWQLKRQLQIKENEPLDVHEVRMARQQIEDYYRQEGYPQTQVSVADGAETGEQDVVFIINEDNKERVLWVEFEGNEFATDSRLRSFVKAKPTLLSSIKGFAIDRNEVEQDVARLTAYYRTFGFFNARIGREVIESPDSSWVRVRFVIDEGPRYEVSGVSFIGNEKYAAEQLESLLKLRPVDGVRPEFNSAQMKTDVTALRDLYGSQGHVFADIQVEPRFLDEPGKIELVYMVEEGKQFRVGRINVHIEGDAGITKRSVVLNRLETKPGEIISSKEMMTSERAIRSSQVFADGSPGTGQPPRITVNPEVLKDLQRYAENDSGIR